MAIQKSITDEFGATHSESYTKIAYVMLMPEQTDLLIHIYHNAATRSKGDASSEKLPFIDRQVRITDSSGSITNDIDQGNLNSGATATYQSSIVLESGDSLLIYNTEQPFTVTTTYLEIRNPPTRS